MAATRAVLQVFEKYQKDRVAFVQTVAELATRPQNVEPMQSAGVMALLRPLLLDNVPRCEEGPKPAHAFNARSRRGARRRRGAPCGARGVARARRSAIAPAPKMARRRVAAQFSDPRPPILSPASARAASRSPPHPSIPPSLPRRSRPRDSIQQSAAIALGRLANYSDHLAEAVVSNEILPQLVYSLSEQNRFYKQAAAFVLRAVAKHSPPLAQAVVDSGALDSLVQCLEEFDPGVKESAAWALGYVAGHNADLAATVGLSIYHWSPYDGVGVVNAVP